MREIFETPEEGGTEEGGGDQPQPEGDDEESS